MGVGWGEGSEKLVNGGAAALLAPLSSLGCFGPDPFASFPNGWTGKQKSPDGVHRVRVDFKVWHRVGGDSGGKKRVGYE